MPFASRDAGDVGQVVLLLRVVGPDPGKPLFQKLCRRGDDAGVALAHPQLGCARILLLDDLADPLLAGVAHDAPITSRVLKEHGQNGKCFCVRDRQESFERVATDERHIAVQHEHPMIVRDRRQRLHDGVTGAMLLGLSHPRDRRCGERARHALAAMSVDDVNRGG